jgi:glycerophosphoryl diester phosphodiesterase
VEKYGQKMHLFIEVKSPFLEVDGLYDLLKSLKPCTDYHVLTLDEALLPLLSQKFPREALLLVAVHNNVKRFCELSLKEGYGGVLGHYLLLNKRTISALKSMNQKVGVGFVDSRYGLYRELNRGVKWLFSNDVEQVMAAWEKLFYTQATSKS